MGNNIPTTISASVELIIGDIDFGGDHCKHLEWSSFLNNGYVVRGEIDDPNHINLKKLAGSSDEPKLSYLQDGRMKPVPVSFKYFWVGGSENATTKRVAYLIGLRGRGRGQEASFEFIAIDPPSFLLNAGTADGRVYQGKISEVIKQVILDFTGDTEGVPNLEVDVSDTNDNDKNTWYMARQDPKTFILSLIDFSSSMSSDKSRWIISSTDTKINIKKESDLEGVNLGVLSVAEVNFSSRYVNYWQLVMNNFVSAYQSRLVTAGISAISGQYLDIRNTPDDVIVKDENTGSKRNVDIKSDRSFTKPGRSDVWPQGLPATFIMAIPEQNAGDIGITYSDYIDGRARQKFINMLGMIMRIVVNVDGFKLADSSELLGVSTVSLTWADAEGELYFLHGPWMLYGFKHEYFDNTGKWETSLYLSRIDHDAEAKKLNPPLAQ